MRMKLAVFVATIGLVAFGATVVAHHAVGAEYDGNKPVKLTSTSPRPMAARSTGTSSWPQEARSCGRGGRHVP